MTCLRSFFLPLIFLLMLAAVTPATAQEESPLQGRALSLLRLETFTFLVQRMNHLLIKPARINLSYSLNPERFNRLNGSDGLPDFEHKHRPYTPQRLGLNIFPAEHSSLRNPFDQEPDELNLGFNFKLMTLEYSSYTDEQSGLFGDKTERRYLIQFALDW